MNILVGNKGHVDFDSPLEVTPEQKEKIKKFFEELFSFVESEPIEEFRKVRLGERKRYPSPWSPKEYEALLRTENTEKLAESLGRSWMSVDIKRGNFYPLFMNWVNKKGKDIARDDLKDLIEEFLKGKEIEKIIRKKKKKQNRKILKEIERLEDHKEYLRSPQKRKSLEILNINNEVGDIDEFIDEQVREVEMKIIDLQNEIDE